MLSQITSVGAFTSEVAGQINSNFTTVAVGPTQGNVYWVAPYTGNDNNDGSSAGQALKSLRAALAKCVPNQNDTVLFLSQGNASARATDYQSAPLDWNKDLVHLIGINDGPIYSQRSRIAWQSTYDAANVLFTVSANGCLIQNIQVYAGVAGTLPTGGVKVTGDRNHFVNCHFVGMGNAANDIAGAYSLMLSGAEENFFDHCTIGVDTVTLGAAINSVMYFDSGATRNDFRQCRFMLYTAHATNTQFIRAAAGSMDRYQVFEDCLFLNAIDSGSTALTQAATIAAGGSPAGGVLLVGRTAVIGATDWNATDAGNVSGMGYTVTANSFGLAADIAR